MKNTENMSLDELLELENKTFIFSKNDINRLIKFIPIICFNKYLNDIIFDIPKFTDVISINDNFSNSYDKYRNNSLIRKELVRLYNILINDLINEINKLYISDDYISISILIGDYLIPRGYLSYTNKFHNTNSSSLFETELDYYETFYLEGLYVICGYGCCRHINSFIADLFNAMGLKCDKLTCIYGDIKLLNKKVENFDFSPNHLMLGYVYENKYNLIDTYNSRYSYTEYNNYYFDNYSHYGIIPFFDENLYQKELYWSPNISIYLNSDEEINNKKNNVFKCFFEEWLDIFINFKEKHFDIYEKIAYLAPLDLNRTSEKEYEKLKRLR